MSAWKHRPWAKGVLDHSESASRSFGDSAKVHALFAIAYAILDCGDALRDVAKTLKGVRRGDDR